MTYQDLLINYVMFFFKKSVLRSNKKEHQDHKVLSYNFVILTKKLTEI